MASERLPLIQQDFALQRQRLGVVRIRRQPPVDLGRHRIQLIVSFDALQPLGNDVSLEADEIARHGSLPRLGRLHDLAGRQIDANDLGAAQRQEVAIAALRSRGRSASCSPAGSPRGPPTPVFHRPAERRALA